MELDQKIKNVAYALSCTFIGRQDDEKSFVMQLLGDEGERIYDVNTRFDYHVLDAVDKYSTRVTNVDHFLNKVNEALASCEFLKLEPTDIDISPFNHEPPSTALKSVSFDLNKNLYEGVLNEFLNIEGMKYLKSEEAQEKYMCTEEEFQKKNDDSCKRRLFVIISHGAPTKARLIAHFLLPYNVLMKTRMNFSDDVNRRLLEVLKEWNSCTPPELKTWKRLRSLLIFLELPSLVERIEDDVTHWTVGKDYSKRYNATSEKLSNLVVNLNTTINKEEADENNRERDEDRLDSGEQLVNDDEKTGNKTKRNMAEKEDVGESSENGEENNGVENEEEESEVNDGEQKDESDESSVEEGSGDETGGEEIEMDEKNPAHDEERKKLIIDDLSYIIIHELSKILDSMSIMDKSNYIGLARSLEMSEDYIKLLKLNAAGGGCPAYHFLDNLCTTKATTPVKKLIKALRKDNMPEGLGIILNDVRKQTLSGITHEVKEKLAIGLTHSEVGKSYVGDWKTVAAYFEYKMDEIDLLATSIQSNASYSPTKALFDLLRQSVPDLPLVCLADTLGRIGNKKAKKTLDIFIVRKVSKKLVKKGK